MLRLSLLSLSIALLLPHARAQQLACDQPQVSLRPGQTACVRVRTVPPAAGVPVQPGFNAAIVTVSPSTTTNTGPNGDVIFVVGCASISAAPSTVTFTDPGGTHQGATSSVVCDYPQLTLGGSAGSYPGTLTMTLKATPAPAPGSLCAILLDGSPGPLPVGLLNPGDPRLLSIGFTFLILPGFSGIFAPPGFDTFTTPTIPVPNLGVKTLLYAQGVSLGFPIVQSISQAQPLYFAPANAFCDRFKTMIVSRSFFPVLETQDQKPIAAGGGLGGIFAQIATDACDVYDPLTDSWSSLGATMTTQRSLHTATRLKNGKWLLCGGVDIQNNPQDKAEIYDPTTNTFWPVANMGSVRMGHSATLLADGRVLIAGGLTVVSTNFIATINSAQSSTELFVLDATGCNGTFVPGPTMVKGRAGHGAQMLADGRLLLAGGVGPGLFGLPAIWKETELFNGTVFAAGPSMGNARAIFPMTQIGTNPDRYLVAGGLGSVLLLGAPTASAEVYTASTGGNGSWASAGSMASARGMQASYLYGTKVIQIGGIQGDLINPVALASSELYDVNAGTWSAGPSMTTARGAYGVYQDPYGAVHIMGGAAGPGTNPPVTASTEWYFR